MPNKSKTEVVLDLTKESEPFEVLKKVGIPPLARDGRRSRYPFDELEVEDGFRVPSAKAKNVGMSARAYGKRNNVKFIIRRDPEVEGCHLVVRVS